MTDVLLDPFQSHNLQRGTLNQNLYHKTYLIKEADICVRLLAVDTQEAQAGETVMDVDEDNIMIQDEGR